MEASKPALPRKVVDTFVGEMYFPDEKITKICISQRKKPEDYYYWEFKKVNLIEDSVNNVRYLIGDFEGNENWYPCSLKAFIYKDGRMLGTVRYLAESGWKDDKLDGRYLDLGSGGYILHGFWLKEGKLEAKESFLFFVQKPEVVIPSVSGISTTTEKVTPKKEKPQKSLSSAKVSQAKTQTAAVTQKAAVNSVALKKKAKAAVVKKEKEASHEEITHGFVKLGVEQDRKAALHFLSYMLIKIGYEVQLLEDGINLPDLLISRGEVTSFVYLHTSNKKKANWRVSVSKLQRQHYFIFCHTVSEEFFPDIYILKGSEVSSWLKRYPKLSVEDKLMANRKNSWGPLS